MSTPQTIVIYRLGSLGDTIVALPCFNAVARRFPNARRLVLTNVPVSAKAAPLLAVLGEDAGIVHGAVSYPVGLRSPAALLKLMRELRSLGADTLVYMMPNRGAAVAWRDWLFFRLAGFRNILAFPSTADLRNNHIDPTGQVEPEAERLVRCFADFGAIDLMRPEAWDLRLSEAEQLAGRQMTAPLAGKPYIAINMGGKAVEKDWGAYSWQRLFARLRPSFGHYGLLVVGADADAGRADELLAEWPGQTVNSCGRLAPRESAAAMEKAVLFVGHDSGPLHLAAAMGVPSLGLFGDFNRPKKWHPIGRSVRVIHNMAGISAISVDLVEATLREMLAATASIPVAASGA